MRAMFGLSLNMVITVKMVKMRKMLRMRLGSKLVKRLMVVWVKMRDMLRMRQLLKNLMEGWVKMRNLLGMRLGGRQIGSFMRRGGSW